MKAKSTQNRRSRKSADFPLSRHPRGYWCKRYKVTGTKFWKMAYFQKIADDPEGKASLDEWLRVKDHLLAGKPRPALDSSDDRLTVAELCDRFLGSKYDKLQCGELSPRSFADCKMATDRIVRVLGKGAVVEELLPDHFAQLRRDIAKTRNPESVGNEINRIRGVFKWGTDNHLIERVVKYGSEFQRPSRRVLRKVRSERERKFLEADEIRQMIDGANIQLRAMILLGVNAGLGNSDVANLPITAVDLGAGWLNFPRPKTGIDRRCPLWPETTAAIKAWLAIRPAPKNQAHRGLLFLTAKTRTTWAIDQRVSLDSDDVERLAKDCLKASDNPISKEVRKLLNKLGIKRKGVAFYSLRHVFETIGGRCKDQVAVDAIMGHADESMAARYREEVDDSRLLAVTNTVRAWLFPEAAGAAPEAGQERAEKVLFRVVTAS